ncbi:hypothetical protein TNCV_3202791 [Trichonephila clavipes]|nr:hypothetical protein TNCV_3202791 [Trichonephila clavipes]
MYSRSQWCIVVWEVTIWNSKVTFVNISSTLMLQDYSPNFIVRGSIIVIQNPFPLNSIRLFASLLHISFLGFGWKRVAINSGPKNPKDLLKKRRVRRHRPSVVKELFSVFEESQQSTVIIKSEVSRLRQQSSALYLELRCSLCWSFVGGVGVTSKEIQCDWLKPVSVVWL